MSLLLQLQNIEKAFGDQAVLAGIDLSVEPGEAVGIVGPNGAGKTTLLKITAGVLPPDTGQVSVGGDPIASMDRRETARRIAVVPQANPQVFDYSVLEFVLMGHYARAGGFVPDDTEINAGIEALNKLQLESLADRAVSQLSGGEMQRALVARAAVASAPLWLLDEPTASLDVRHRSTVLKRVRNHVDSGGSAVAVLHDLELVHRFFDRVVALADGTVFADGPPDEVLTDEVVSEMYAAPMRRGEVDGQVVWVAGE